MKDDDVVVVGAGPTGLTLASELARHGVRCRIIDKAAGPAEHSGAFAIHARTLELLENMGVVGPVLETGHSYRGVTIYNKGKRLAQPELNWIESKYPFLQVLPQRETERLLGEHLVSRGVEVERSTELRAFAQSADGVKLTLQREGNEEETRCQYLVGCDGAHSTVRDVLAPGYEVKPFSSHWLVADVTLAWDHPTDRFALLIHPKGVTAWFPFGGEHGRLMFELGGRPDPAEGPEPSVEKVKQLMAERELTTESFGEPTWLAWYQPQHQMCEKYAEGRVFLAGDAARVYSPVGAQGMNAGIQDAYNLAWKLALVVRGKSPAALLESYHEERHRVGKIAGQKTDRATKMIGLRNPVLRTMRNAFMSVATKMGAVQEKITQTFSQTEVHYRESPIVQSKWVKVKALEGFDAAKVDIDAGERVDDFALTRGNEHKRLYELLDGAEHELFLFAGRHPGGAEMKTLAAIHDQVQAKYGRDLIEIHFVHGPGDPPADGPQTESTWVDEEFAMHEAFGAGLASLYLVRPDGYVGFRNQPADPIAMMSYLETVFVTA